jgi:hypothetical protein
VSGKALAKFRISGCAIVPPLLKQAQKRKDGEMTKAGIIAKQNREDIHNNIKSLLKIGQIREGCTEDLLI